MEFDLSCCNKSVDREVATKLANRFITRLTGILESCKGADPNYSMAGLKKDALKDLRSALSAMREEKR